MQSCKPELGCIGVLAVIVALLALITISGLPALCRSSADFEKFAGWTTTAIITTVDSEARDATIQRRENSKGQRFDQD